MLLVHEINNLEDLCLIQGAWNELLELEKRDCIFMTFEWLTTWWRYFGAGKQLFILVVKEGREITGIVPWMIRQVWKGRLNRRKIEFIGTGLSDWLDFIIPYRKEEHLELIFRYLQERPMAWDLMDLREIPSSSENAIILQKVLHKNGTMYSIYPDSICPYIEIQTDWDSFLKEQFSGKTRWQMRRSEKRLHKEGEVRIKLLRDLTEEPGTIQRIVQMRQSEYYRGKKRQGLFDDPAKRGFFEEIISLFSPKGWVNIPLLELSGQLIAYRLDFQFRGRYYGYFLGFNPGFSFCTPGKVLMTHLIKECFDKQMAEFDFLRGDESYKFDWTNKYRQNMRIMLFRPSLWGRLLYMWYKSKRVLSKRSERK